MPLYHTTIHYCQIFDQNVIGVAIIKVWYHCESISIIMVSKHVYSIRRNRMRNEEVAMKGALSNQILMFKIKFKM